MIVWDGSQGGIYTPGAAGSSGTWTAMPTTTVPGAYGEVMVWDGTRLLVALNWNANGYEIGARFDLASKTWSSTASSAVASNWDRSSYTTAWTGKDMIVFFGSGDGGDYPQADHYNPANNSWQSVPSPTGALFTSPSL